MKGYVCKNMDYEIGTIINSIDVKTRKTLANPFNNIKMKLKSNMSCSYYILFLIHKNLLDPFYFSLYKSVDAETVSQFFAVYLMIATTVHTCILF